jgi:hypothetical protein
MCAYMYPVNIYYGYEVVKHYHEKKIANPLTVDKLQKIVGDSKFSIANSNDHAFDDDMIISWYTYKLETMQERKRRIEKLEDYNKKVDIHRKVWDEKKAKK